jgi:hypothetical protein
MVPRTVFTTFIVAFCVAITFATVTTIRQVNLHDMHTSSDRPAA